MRGCNNEAWSIESPVSFAATPVGKRAFSNAQDQENHPSATAATLLDGRPLLLLQVYAVRGAMGQEGFSEEPP